MPSKVDQTLISRFTKPGKARKIEPVEAAKLDHARFFFFRAWGIIGAVIVIAGIFFALGKISEAVSVIITAAMICFIASPVVDFLEEKKIPRVLGTLIAFLIGLALISLVFALFMPLIVEQLTSLVNNIPNYVVQTQIWVNSLYSQYGQIVVNNAEVQDAIRKIANSVGNAAMAIVNQAGGGIVSAGSSFVGGLAVSFMALVVAFWLTMDLPKFKREIIVMVGPKRAEEFEIMTSVCSRALGGYLKGLIISSTCTGVLAGLGFWIIGIPYAGLLGLITGLLNIIPFIGPWTGGAIAALMGLFVNPLAAVLSIVVTILAQQLTDTFVSPLVMKQAVSIHPALVIIGLAAGGALGGVLGMIFAVPAIAAVKGVFVYYFERNTGRQLINEDGALFEGKPFNTPDGNPIPALDATGGSRYYAAAYADTSQDKQDSRFSFSASNLMKRAQKEKEESKKEARKEEIKEEIKEELFEVKEGIQEALSLDDKSQKSNQADQDRKEN